MTTGGFELRISCIQVLQIHPAYYALWPSGLGNYFVSKRFTVQTLLWSQFVIQIILEHSTIAHSIALIAELTCVCRVVLKLVKVLLLIKMFKVLELSGLSVCLGDL